MHDGAVDALELIVDRGRAANAWRFFQLGHDLLELLDELSDVPVAWRITELKTGSALATVAPPKDQPEEARVLRLAVDSLRVVQGGGGLSDDDWSPDAIRVAHKFVDHGRPVGDEPDWTPPRLVLVTNHDAPEGYPGVDLTPELGERLGQLQPFERSMPGAVRGELVGVNVSRGNRASLRLPNKRIVRVGFDTSLRDALRDAMYRQVELSGAVRQDCDGRVCVGRLRGLAGGPLKALGETGRALCMAPERRARVGVRLRSQCRRRHGRPAPTAMVGLRPYGAGLPAIHRPFPAPS